MKFNHMTKLLVVAGLFAVVGCGGTKVTRLDPTSTTDLSGRWNDTDSRQVSEVMIADCLSSPWLFNHIQASGGAKPVVIVAVIQNKTSEHISTDTFINDMERAMINSNDVTVVASADEREQLRDERADQQTFSSEETMKEWGREVGADYIMGGTISSIVDQVSGEKVVYYQVDLTLINLEDNTKVWLGQKKIKKLIDNPKASM